MDRPLLQVEFLNVASSVAIAQATDVFIGMHGANHMNSLFMQPGSSAVELTPYEWDKDYWGAAYAQFNNQASCLHTALAMQMLGNM